MSRDAILTGLALMVASQTHPTRAGAPSLRFLALGDSYTIGEGVNDAERWPMQLARQLRAEGIALQDPRVIATTGWTTADLSAAMDAVEPLGQWDFVSLLIGVNNQYQGRPADEFRCEFAALLERAITLAGGRTGRVLVLAIPDWGVTPFAADRNRGKIAAELDEFNALQRAECERRGVSFLDVAPISRTLGADPAHLTDDGLHPGAALYRAWTAEAIKVARKALESR